MAHNIALGTADEVLAAAARAGRPVRYWLTSGGSICGAFKARSGKTVGVGTESSYGNGRSRVYFAMAPSDNWALGTTRPATVEDMAVYRFNIQAEAAE